MTGASSEGVARRAAGKGESSAGDCYKSSPRRAQASRGATAPTAETPAAAANSSSMHQKAWSRAAVVAWLAVATVVAFPGIDEDHDDGGGYGGGYDGGYDHGGGHVKIVRVSVPHPVPVEVPHPVPVAVPQSYPLHIRVPQFIEVPVVHNEQVTVEKPVPVPVEKIVPFPVERPVPVHIEKQVPVPVPKPYPVKVPVVKTIHHYVKHKW